MGPKPRPLLDVELNRTGKRASYKPEIPSVTELLRWIGYYDQYPNDPTGYFYRRGAFIEQCGTILLQGQELDDRTQGLAAMGMATPSGGLETWDGYILPLRKWISQHKIKFIAAQQYVYNAWETYQGTLDWLLEIDGALTVVDCKTGTCPKATALQTAGYAMAAGNMGNNMLVRAQASATLKRLGLQLEPGKCTPHPYDNSRDYDAFRILARCWWKHGPQSKEYR